MLYSADDWLYTFKVQFMWKGFSWKLVAQITDWSAPFSGYAYIKHHFCRGWSGGAMVLGKLPVPGRPTILITVGQGPTALAVGAGGGCLDIFSLIYPISILSPSLWETARYRLKYCLKGPLNPKQPTNQPFLHIVLIWYIDPVALRKTQTLWYFGHSECHRVKKGQWNLDGLRIAIL